MLGNYTSLELIGKGTYGKIYKAVRRSDNVVVALKKVNLKRQSSQEQTDTLNEIRVMERVDHPNIVKFYEAFLEGGSIYIVMEYLGGGDLSALIRWHSAAKTPIPEETLWRYCAELASAFKYMHAMCIIHRDIKPSNILISSTPSTLGTSNNSTPNNPNSNPNPNPNISSNNSLNNQLKVADFGFGKLLGAQLMAYSSVGTPIYYSPEAISGLGYNESTDIWGLGCVMYELATFRVPFNARNLGDLRRAILYEKPAPIPAVYSKDMENLIMSMLCKDPKIRPSAAQILAYPPLCKRFPELNAAIFHDEEEEIVADIRRSIESGESSAAQTNRLIRMLAVERHRCKELQAAMAEAAKKMRVMEKSLSDQVFAMDALAKENAQLKLRLKSLEEEEERERENEEDNEETRRGQNNDSSDEMVVSPVKHQPPPSQRCVPVTPKKGVIFHTTPMKTEGEGFESASEMDNGVDVDDEDSDDKECPVPGDKKDAMSGGIYGKVGPVCSSSSTGSVGSRSKGRSNSAGVKALTFSPETPMKPKSKRSCTHETPFKYSCKYRLLLALFVIIIL